jgi:hypothetical protein
LDYVPLIRQAGKGWTKDPKNVPSTVNNFFCPYSSQLNSFPNLPLVFQKALQFFLSMIDQPSII